MSIREGAIIFISVINFNKCCNADSHNLNKNSIMSVCSKLFMVEIFCCPTFSFLRVRHSNSFRQAVCVFIFLHSIVRAFFDSKKKKYCFKILTCFLNSTPGWEGEGKWRRKEIWRVADVLKTVNGHQFSNRLLGMQVLLMKMLVQ